MALSFGNFVRKLPEKGGFRSGYVDIVLDDSYSAGGWAIAASDISLSTLHTLVPPSAKNGFALGWNHVTGKLMAWKENNAGGETGTALQEIAADDLDAAVIRCFYEGW